MREISIVNAVCFVFIASCNGQAEFTEFQAKFRLVNLPIDSVQFLMPSDTLDVKFFNNVVWESQPKEDKNGKKRVVPPKVFKNGKAVDLISFGKVSDTHLNYETIDGKPGQFYAKVYAIGKVNLHPSYISLIVRTYNTELSYYDLYNFTTDGIRLSAVPLFTYGHEKMLVDSIDHVYTKSSISKDGRIVWCENNRGLKTNRVYRLRDDGYFEIVKEERTGKFEY